MVVCKRVCVPVLDMGVCQCIGGLVRSVPLCAHLCVCERVCVFVHVMDVLVCKCGFLHAFTCLYVSRVCSFVRACLSVHVCVSVCVCVFVCTQRLLSVTEGWGLSIISFNYLERCEARLN